MGEESQARADEEILSAFVLLFSIPLLLLWTTFFSLALILLLCTASHSLGQTQIGLHGKTYK